MTKEQYGQAYQRGFEGTVRFLLSRGCSSRDWASEIAQWAWVRGWERLYQLREESTVVTWVNTIALNAHRAYLRREGVFEELRDSFTDSGMNVAAIDMARLLKVCRPCDRLLLEQQMGGVTTEEIARSHGVTETAIRNRLLRARRAIRSRIERRPVMQAAVATSGVARTGLATSALPTSGLPTSSLATSGLPTSGMATSTLATATLATSALTTSALTTSALTTSALTTSSMSSARSAA